MKNFPEKIQQLQEQGLLQELTPEEAEQLKGGIIDFDLGQDFPPLNKILKKYRAQTCLCSNNNNDFHVAFAQSGVDKDRVYAFAYAYVQNW